MASKNVGYQRYKLEEAMMFLDEANNKLRSAEVFLGEGKAVNMRCRRLIEQLFDENDIVPKKRALEKCPVRFRPPPTPAKKPRKAKDPAESHNGDSETLERADHIPRTPNAGVPTVAPPAVAEVGDEADYSNS